MGSRSLNALFFVWFHVSFTRYFNSFSLRVGSRGIEPQKDLCKT